MSVAFLALGWGADAAPNCCGGATCTGSGLGVCCLLAGASCWSAADCCSQSCNATSATCD